MKVLNYEVVKKTSVFLLFILFSYVLISIISPCKLIVPITEAASISQDDIYKGLGIALILILISEIGKSMESNPSRSDSRENINPDLELLARVIYAESRGEPFIGQVAVGAVVINRIKSNEFPETVEGVVYQGGQFSSVDDGQINLIPNSSAYDAARKAIEGDDPSLGAQYFYNPDKAKTLWWLETRELTVRIGNHVFAK